MDSQAEQLQLALATWPEHLFEHFFVIVSQEWRRSFTSAIAPGAWGFMLTGAQAARYHASPSSRE